LKGGERRKKKKERKGERTSLLLPSYFPQLVEGMGEEKGRKEERLFFLICTIPFSRSGGGRKEGRKKKEKGKKSQIFQLPYFLILYSPGEEGEE